MEELTPLFAIEAEKLLKIQKSDDAIELCLKGISIYPEYQAAYGVLALAYSQNNEPDSAIAILDRAVALFPLNEYLVTLKIETEKKIEEDKAKKVIIDEMIDIQNQNLDIKEERSELLSDIDENLLHFADSSDIADDTTVNPNNLEEFYSEESNIAGDTEYHELNPPIEIEDFKQREEFIETLGSFNEKKVTANPEPPAPKFVKLDEMTFDEEPEEEKPYDSGRSFLKLIQQADTSQDENEMQLKADNLIIIPGLEYSPLRVKSRKIQSVNHFKPVPEPPPFPSYIEKKEENQDDEPEMNYIDNNFVSPHTSSLQELAAQLKQISTFDDEYDEASPEESEEQSQNVHLPLTETLAGIYIQQGAIDEAISVYKTLSLKNPDKKDYYEDKINRLENLE